MAMTNKIKDGDIFFTMDKSILSRSIRLVTTGKVGMQVPSHVGVISIVYTINGDKRICTIESLYTAGVSRRTLAKRLKNKDVTIWIGRLKKPRNIIKGLRWLETQVGMDYDYTALLGILAKAAFRFLGLHKIASVRNFLESRSRFFCSELVCEYGKKTGKRLWHHKSCETTPYDLFRSKEIKVYKWL